MVQETQKRNPQLTCNIWECYKNPMPINTRKTIEKLLLAISQEYLVGLDGIVLCDEPSFKEHYGNDEKISAARYIRTKDGKSSWIEMCVDRLIKGMTWDLKICLFRDLIFSDALYHEIGHHIHCTQGPHDKECENVAEKWRKHFQKRYLFKRYWFVAIPLLIILIPFKRHKPTWIEYCRSEKSESSLPNSCSDSSFPNLEKTRDDWRKT